MNYHLGNRKGQYSCVCLGTTDRTLRLVCYFEWRKEVKQGAATLLEQECFEPIDIHNGKSNSFGIISALAVVDRVFPALSAPQ